MPSRFARLVLTAAVLVAATAGGFAASRVGALTLGPTQIYGVGGNFHDGTVFGVSCTAAGCVAVGTNESIQHPLVVTGIPTAPVAGYADGDAGRHFLSDVWCATTSSCVAVGVADNATGNHQYITELSGGVWTRVAAVDPPDINPIGGHGIHLRDVSCVDVENCVAVGEYQTNSGATPPNGVRGIAYSKVGGTWSVQVLEPAGSVVDNMTNPPTTQLTSVRCLSATTCVAVGTYAIGAGTSVRPYLAVGTVAGATMTWATSDLPIPDFQSSFSSLDQSYFLFGPAPLLDCASPSDCVVAGTYVSTSSSAVRTYVWSFTGGAWAPEAATYATDPSDPNVPRALACPAPTRCYAVGNTVSGAHGTVVTLDHGVPSLTILDQPGNETNWLVAIGCPTPRNCGVGGYGKVPSGALHVTVGAREAGAWAMGPSFAEIPSEVSGRVRSGNALACQPDGTCVLGATNGTSEWSATLTTFTITLDPPETDSGGGVAPRVPAFTG